MPTSDIAVELRGVTKRFRQRQPSARWRDIPRNLLRPVIREVLALEGVDLVVRRGEIVAYAGPNGAGKSTTVKMLSGMLAPTTGTVRALGVDPVRDRIGYMRRAGIVFGQRTELWWDLPIAASFEWKRAVWDIDRATFERMLGLGKDLLGVGEFFNTLMRELSLGQRMRADLALALLHDPEILILDEPTIGLDVLAKRAVLDFLRQLNRDRGATVLITSHDMAELERLAGRIVLIDKGRIAFDGDFGELRSKFATDRHLLLMTGEGSAPRLDKARLVSSEAGRHEYRFDAAQATVSSLLEEASRQIEVLDVETHRAPIDEVIAAIYESWKRPAIDRSDSSDLSDLSARV